MTLRRIPVAAPVLNGNERRYVLECLDSNWISTRGVFVGRFESAFADWVQTPAALACSSGTAALHLCLAALGLGPGDEVLIPALTYVATANAVRYVGAIPVTVDVDPETWVLDAAQLETHLGPRTRAIVPVHLYGQPVDMDLVLAMAHARGLWVVEDAAQALGTRYRGRPVGGLGDVAAFSFFANKTLTCGHGGMVTTADPALAARARALAWVGNHSGQPYRHEEIGFNYAMTNIEAAIGLGQLENVDWHLERRRAVAAQYRQRLAGVSSLTWQAERDWAKSGHWMVSVRFDDRLDRDAGIRYLEDRGIESRMAYPPIHLLPPYQSDKPPSHPVAEGLARQCLSLPTHAALETEDVERVCDALLEFVRRG